MVDDASTIKVDCTSRSEAIVYDLTSPPPAQRTIPDGAVKIADGSNWRHASVIQSYFDGEIESILVFLKAVVQR